MRLRTRKLKPPIASIGCAATDEQIIEFHEVNFMAAPLRLQHQDKRCVLIDVDLIDGVHDHADFSILHSLFSQSYFSLESPRCAPRNHASRAFPAAIESTKSSIPMTQCQIRRFRANEAMPGDR